MSIRFQRSSSVLREETGVKNKTKQKKKPQKNLESWFLSFVSFPQNSLSGRKGFLCCCCCLNKFRVAKTCHPAGLILELIGGFCLGACSPAATPKSDLRSRFTAESLFYLLASSKYPLVIKDTSSEHPVTVVPLWVPRCSADGAEPTGDPMLAEGV